MPPPPPPTPQEIDAQDWARFYGLTNDEQMAAITLQLWYLTEWGKFLNTIDWSKVPSIGGGGAGAPPPPTPKWPP